MVFRSTVGPVALRTAASTASTWRAHCDAASCDCAARVLTPMSISTRSGRAVTLASPVTRIEDTGAAGVCARAGDTATTLATELLLLHRCLESLRESAPAARRLQARIVAHLADTLQVNPACDIFIKLVRHYLEDAGVQVLPEDIAAGPPRTLRFRPAMGWVHTRA